MAPFINFWVLRAAVYGHWGIFVFWDGHLYYKFKMQQVISSSLCLYRKRQEQKTEYAVLSTASEKHRTSTHACTHTSAHGGSGWWRLLGNCLIQTNRLASLPSLVSVYVCVWLWTVGVGDWPVLLFPILPCPACSQSQWQNTVTPLPHVCFLKATHWRLNCERGACIYVCMCVYLLKRSLGFFAANQLLSFPSLRQPTWLGTHQYCRQGFQFFLKIK